MFALALLLCLSVVHVSAFGGFRDDLPAAPAGKYCGSYQSIVSINVTIVSPTVAALSAEVFGSEGVSCPSEAYIFSSKTNAVTFPHITAPNDCLGGDLNEFGVDPSSLSVVFIPASNKLGLTVANPPVQITLSSCK